MPALRARRRAAARAVAAAGAAGREVQAGICADCWAEWAKAEVMVINELRLNFMDPASQEILNRQMREFLHLPAGGPGRPEGPSSPGGSGGASGDVSH